jgi:hypothetical protein
MIDLDNAPAHNPKRSRETLEATGAIRVTYHASHRDIAPSDLYLLGNLKEKWRSVAVTHRHSRGSAMTQIFNDTPQSELIAIDQKWMKRFY